MKKILISAIVLFTLLVSVPSYSSITYLLDNRCGATGQVVVLVTPDINYPLGTTASWGVGLFTLSWPMSLGSGVLGSVSNQNGFAFAAAGALGNDGTNYYQKFSHVAPNSLPMTAGSTYEVVRINLIGSVGVYGDFQIPASDNAWVVTNLAKSSLENGNGNQVPSTYAAATVEDIPLFAGIFWNGTKWCGGSGSNEQPGPGDASLSCYVNSIGAQLTTPHTNHAIVSNLTIATSSQLTIMPGGALTVNNITTINSPQGLVIAAGPTGSGSFINNATVANTVYNSGGSATVQSYLKNIANVGSFQMHLIGPTVFDPTIFDQTGTGPAYVRLGAYNMQAGGTFAYWYRESINNWINIWQTTDSIPRLGGIALSDISGTSKTIALTGKLSTGSVFDPTQPSKWDPTITSGQGNGTYMFSNPYPSYLSLTQFFLSNNSPTARITNPAMWTWEHENGTFGTWFYDDELEQWDGTGHIGDANGIINPGQGFFAQIAITSSQVRAAQGHRLHGHTPFLKSTIPYSLRISASGNYTYEEAIIKFRLSASAGFDENIDVEKWASMYEEATQIYTLSSDQTMLTVNAMPSLQAGQMVSVPMGFLCGADDTYNIAASNIESFDYGTEIWLEDLKLGGEWHSLVQNPVYEFTAAPGDPEARFVVHFFSTTSIDDPNAGANAISIYGYGQDAYILNRGTETVKEYVAYDMMGREMHRGTLPNSTVNKVTIGDVTAYYIVKVFTKEGRVYTDKVFINK